ncbi:hypothetical protein C1645_811677 [Glomus cerebriforme]|uniref:Uncharacterized protein n=1 Tax=Glomus cerebriforme TaxID=658196 RepID=A0A397TQK3_9GLOM|nr:hypothetical protein C1645_811677 [Glomus cerebriforme]
MSLEKEKELKECIKEKEREKELYSKECVAECINFAVGTASAENTYLATHERFACYLATILARDKEVVAVRLKVLPNSCDIYLSKNFHWLDKDVKYINEIQNYLKDISKSAPTILKGTESAFTKAVMLYCSAKLESRLEKLKKDIEISNNSEYVNSFIDFFSTKVNDINDGENMYTISQICMEYYKKIKDKSNISSKFLGHIKKVGSYVGSMLGIIECARNIQYKPLFSIIRVFKRNPDIINNQSIYSWKNIIKRFIDENNYKCFMDRCSKKPKVMERWRKVYTNIGTQQQQLDGNDVKQCIYLHAEMNILALIIDDKIKSREFIAVSKRCCYLCELYIDFARRHGYNIIVSGNHKKIYSGWKLLNVKDNTFKIEALRYILENLDRILENKIKYYAKSLQADSDNGENNLDPKNSDSGYLGKYFNQYNEYVNKFTLVEKRVSRK